MKDEEPQDGASQATAAYSQDVEDGQVGEDTGPGDGDQSGAAQRLAERGYRLQAVLTLTGLLDYWEATGKVPAEQIAETRRFLDVPPVPPTVVQA